MNTLSQVVENLRRDRPEDDTESRLVFRAAVLMALGQIEAEGLVPSREKIEAETELILAQYPDLWPVTE